MTDAAGSIYPQALQGCIQLTPSDVPDKNTDKYLTPEIINSPFNKIPPAGGNKYLLTLDENRFFALSWLIAELGKLKDGGLRVLLISEALQETKGISRAEAEKECYRFLAPNASKLPTLLSTASRICKEFFAEGNLDQLLIKNQR